ncbi:nucleotidyltransferase domain-containing protein [Micromonospora echinofusca]|uniref:DNA polymerase subunit beta n=1 Tax=Micromonospora echinofusca TaxID=47858 RepID=A0ABS3VJR7_MICEH|nr:nucleotidyltransferase domain-containing protein [Micromonospora echinofusca]MBO4204716.1 DNA polymerase subunit beta [Micromonospora echinofusca]
MIPDDLPARLVAVDGVVAVALGGSRARGTHRPDSDWDLGLYYRGRLDVDGLRTVAATVADGPVELTGPGGWGPWVDGGGWLRIGGAAVDWIYRDTDRVRSVWADCRAGRYQVGTQPGHPLGFYSHAYAGEVALGRVLADPTGELTALHAATRHYPPALGAALVAAGWEAGFLLDGATKAVPAGDSSYLAGCLFRVVGVLVHALHGRAGRWLVNEKGMVDAAGTLPGAPPGFAERAHRLLAAPGRRPDELAASVAEARRLVADVLD